MSQRNIPLLLSAAALMSLAVLGMAVHASTVSTDKRAKESCSSAAHKQFHTDAKKATKEWWDQAEPRDEKGHQKLLKELKKQHTAFHKAMRGKKSCLPVSLPTRSSVSSTALPSRSGSAVPTTGSPAKRAAPSPSPAVPSVNVPSPSGNGSPSPSVPTPILSSIASSSAASGSSLSRVSSASSSGTTKSAASSVAAGAPSISAITVRDITVDSATIEWTTDQPVFSQVYWMELPSYGLPAGTVGLTHAVTLEGLMPDTTYNFEVQARDSAGGRILAKVSSQTFKTLPIEWGQGNTTIKIYRLFVGAFEDSYSVTLGDPDNIQRFTMTKWVESPPPCLPSHTFSTKIAPADFPRTVVVKDCAGNWSKFKVELPPLPVVEKPGNTTVQVSRLSGDSTHYPLTIADPDNIRSAAVKRATDGVNVSVNVINDPACLSSSYTDTYLLYPADFPLKAIVTDCAGNASEVTAEMPPQ